MKKLILSIIVLLFCNIYAQQKISQSDSLLTALKIEKTINKNLDIEIDSLKIIINKSILDDTIIGRVDNYLNERNSRIDSWLTILGITVAIFGVLMPFYLLFSNRRLNKDVREELRDVSKDAKETLNKVESDAQIRLSKMDTDLKDILKEYELVKEQRRIIDSQVEKIEESEKKAAESARFSEANRLFDEAFQLHEKKKSKESIEKYSSVIKLLNEETESHKKLLAKAYNNRGNSFSDLEQPQDSINDYNYAIKIEPNVAVQYSNRASSYTELEKYKEAISDCETALKLDKDNQIAHYNMMCVLLLSNDIKLAEEFYEKVSNMEQSEFEKLNLPIFKALIVDKDTQKAKSLIKILEDKGKKVDDDLLRYIKNTEEK